MTDFGSRHKASHQDGGGDEIDCTGLVGRVNYVDRGDPADHDWTLTDLTTDGASHDLDCSSIVPEGAVAIHFSLLARCASTAKNGMIRTKGNANLANTARLYIQTSNVFNAIDAVVKCDQDRKVQYIFSNTTWSSANILIRGWLI